MAQISFFKRSIGMLPKGVRRKVYRIQAVESADQQHALQLRDGSDAITHQDTIVLMISHNFFFFQINAVQPAYSALSCSYRKQSSLWWKYLSTSDAAWFHK